MKVISLFCAIDEIWALVYGSVPQATALNRSKRGARRSLSGRSLKRPGRWMISIIETLQSLQHRANLERQQSIRHMHLVVRVYPD
jgi:hypothetical protein